MRLDLWLVEHKKVSSRSLAQELIEAGQVFLNVNGQRKVLSKSSFKVEPHHIVELESGPADRYVSRGGLKLEGALKEAGIDVSGFHCLDVGISTGGFSDCLLKAQVASVLGVDVGHGQVHTSLHSESRLRFIEGINARDLRGHQQFIELMPSDLFDLIVMDVSFISISLIFPQFRNLLKNGGYVLSLVKPQFEVGPDGLSKGGIVKDVSLYQEVQERIVSMVELHGLKVLKYFESPIQGKDGNHEFFVFAQKSSDF